MSGDLPRGWAEIEIGDLTAPVRPRCTPQEYPRLPFVGMEQVESYSGRLIGTVSSSTMKSTAFQFQPGDILYGRLRPYLNKVLYAELMGLCSSEFIVLPPMGSFDPKYLAFYLRTDGFVSFANQLNQGDRPRVNFGQISSHEVPLAPLAEQKRIVAKVEKMLAKVDASRARMEKVSALLKRFRQSILAAACSGRLTADWRRGRGKAGEWEPSSVGEVVESLKYGTATKCEYAKRGVPVLRIPNVVSGRIDHSDLKYAKLPAKELQQLILVAGDVLLIRSNGSVSLVGRTAVVSRAEEDYAYAGYLIRLRPDRKKVQPAFLNLVLSSYDIRLQIEVEARSTSGVNNINSEEVRELSFQLPALPEQAEIVRRVEELFALADRLEARVEKARGQVEKLTQSILAKAFRGELVPQDPNDEPAEKLLARIRTSVAPPMRVLKSGRRRAG